jgi:hypothetical protein
VNFNTRNPPRSALSEVIDVLLADIATRIQLTKTDHDKAVDRFGSGSSAARASGRSASPRGSEG